MKILKLISDVEDLAARIKAAVDPTGPHGAKIDVAEWGEILKLGLTVAADIGMIVVGVAALAA